MQKLLNNLTYYFLKRAERQFSENASLQNTSYKMQGLKTIYATYYINILENNKINKV